MPFTLSEDHLAFRQSVRTLARSRYADSMLARSLSEKFPTAEFGELGDAGLLGLLISESAGGQGGDVLAVGIAVEELAYADPAIAYLAFAANVSNALLAAHGSDEVRERWVTRGIAGEAVICLALTEPGQGLTRRISPHGPPGSTVAGGSPVRRPRSPRRCTPMSRS